MHISWNFLDKRKAAIKAIEAYNSMNFIIRHTDEDIAEVRVKMEGVGSPNLDGLPHAHNPQVAEDRMIRCIEEIDMLKERYRQAREYMAWFSPAWDQLTDDERFVLEAFYRNSDDNNANQVIQEEMNVSQSGAYNKKNRALDHLTMLLYGKA